MAEKSEEINIPAEEPAKEFQYEIYDFRSNWANGLNIHLTRKHQHIEQLDGSDSFNDDLDEDEKYFKPFSTVKKENLEDYSKHFWIS